MGVIHHLVPRIGGELDVIGEGRLEVLEIPDPVVPVAVELVNGGHRQHVLRVHAVCPDQDASGADRARPARRRRQTVVENPAGIQVPAARLIGRSQVFAGGTERHHLLLVAGKTCLGHQPPGQAGETEIILRAVGLGLPFRLEWLAGGGDLVTLAVFGLRLGLRVRLARWHRDVLIKRLLDRKPELRLHLLADEVFHDVAHLHLSLRGAQVGGEFLIENPNVLSRHRLKPAHIAVCLHTAPGDKSTDVAPGDTRCAT